MRARRKRSRKRFIAVAVVLAAVIIAVVIESGNSHHGAPLPASLPENLTLSGVVNGHFTTATAIQGMTSTFPGGPSGQGSGFGPTNATACVQNSGEGWEIDLYGRVGAHSMSLSLDGDDLNSSNMAANYIGAHNINNNASYGGLVYFYWGSEELQFPMPGSAKLVVNRNGNSGTMDIQFASGPQGGRTVETIKGSWRCA